MLKEEYIMRSMGIGKSNKKIVQLENVMRFCCSGTFRYCCCQQSMGVVSTRPAADSCWFKQGSKKREKAAKKREKAWRGAAPLRIPSWRRC